MRETWNVSGSPRHSPLATRHFSEFSLGPEIWIETAARLLAPVKRNGSQCIGLIRRIGSGRAAELPGRLDGRGRKIDDANQFLLRSPRLIGMGSNLEGRPYQVWQVA